MGILYAKNQNFDHNLHLYIFSSREEKQLFLRTKLTIWSLDCRSNEVLCIVYMDFRLNDIEK
jgi:hypothetical protein